MSSNVLKHWKTDDHWHWIRLEKRLERSSWRFWRISLTELYVLRTEYPAKHQHHHFHCFQWGNAGLHTKWFTSVANLVHTQTIFEMDINSVPVSKKEITLGSNFIILVEPANTAWTSPLHRKSRQSFLHVQWAWFINMQIFLRLAAKNLQRRIHRTTEAKSRQIKTKNHKLYKVQPL